MAHICDPNQTIAADAINNKKNNRKKNPPQLVSIHDAEVPIDISSLGITLAKLAGFIPVHSQKTSLSYNSKKAKARIPNNALRDRIYTLLNHMKNKYPHKRPTLDEIIKTISSLWEYCLDLTSHMKKTALVYLDDLENENHKENILTALRHGHFDEIQLIDRDATRRGQYLDIRKNFVSEYFNLNLPIGNIVHHNVEDLPIKLAQQDQDERVIRQHFLISPNDRLKSQAIFHIDPTSMNKLDIKNTIKARLSAQVVSPMHMKCIESRLHQEYIRLQNKYPKRSFFSFFGIRQNEIAKTRIEEMYQTLTILSTGKDIANNPITYMTLHELLIDLERKMLPVRSFFSNQSTGARNINTIISHLSPIMGK